MPSIPLYPPTFEAFAAIEDTTMGEDKDPWDIRAAGKLVQKYGIENIDAITCDGGYIQDLNQASESYSASQKVHTGKVAQYIDKQARHLPGKSEGARDKFDSWIGKSRVDWVLNLTDSIVDKLGHNVERVTYQAEMNVRLKSGVSMVEKVEVEDLDASLTLLHTAAVGCAGITLPVPGLDSAIPALLGASALLSAGDQAVHGNFPRARASFRTGAQQLALSLLTVLPLMGQVLGSKLSLDICAQLDDVYNSAEEANQLASRGAASAKNDDKPTVTPARLAQAV